jgi:hypothetical protein
VLARLDADIHSGSDLTTLKVEISGRELRDGTKIKVTGYWLLVRQVRSYLGKGEDQHFRSAPAVTCFEMLG